MRELFRGYAGYVQADAKNTYDVLFDTPGEIANRRDLAIAAKDRVQRQDATESGVEIAAKRLSQEMLPFANAKSDKWMARLGAEDLIKEDVLNLLEGADK